MAHELVACCCYCCQGSACAPRNSPCPGVFARSQFMHSRRLAGQCMRYATLGWSKQPCTIHHGGHFVHITCNHRVNRGMSHVLCRRVTLRRQAAHGAEHAGNGGTATGGAECGVQRRAQRLVRHQVRAGPAPRRSRGGLHEPALSYCLRSASGRKRIRNLLIRMSAFKLGSQLSLLENTSCH